MSTSSTSSYGNPVVLSFYECLIRKSDVELLRGPYWLNDTIISFYFEYLEKKEFVNNSFLLFVPPDVTQCVKISPTSEINIFLSPLLAQPRKFIFFALNDNEETDISGGSHWSLLVYSNPEKIVFHFDSSRGSNETQAMEFAHKLFRYFQLTAFGTFVEVRSLQQNNGYDCGIHVLCNVENVAHYANKYHRIEGCSMVSRQIVETKRAHLLGLIKSLQN